MAYNILLVDDSAAMRAVIKRTIGMADVEVGRLFEAGSGAEALKVLEQEWVDLVLVDINMPEMDGIELTRRICANPDTTNIPVVIVSTEASTTRIQALKEMGIKGYVHKPFTPEQIRDAILEAIGGCHAEH